MFAHTHTNDLPSVREGKGFTKERHSIENGLFPCNRNTFQTYPTISDVLV